MNKVIIILLFLYILYLIVKLSLNQENFQNTIMQIPDNDSALPDVDGNTIATFKNVSKYKNMELANKVVKGIIFTNSEMKLTNLKEIKEYTITFHIEFLNAIDNQVIIGSIAKNSNALWYLYIHNNRFYMNFKGLTKKFNTRINRKNIYYIIINFSNEQLKVYLNGEIKFIDNDKIYEYENNITLGGLKKSKLLNPINAVIGNINLYKSVINPLNLSMPTTKCSFIPKGSNVVECANLCQINKKCSKSYCYKVCEKCIDYNKCKWLPTPVNNEITSYIESTEPQPPKIKCYAGDNFIEVRFKHPKNNGNTPITNYMVTLKKTYNIGSFVKIINIDADTCDENRCVYKIKDLENQTFYDVMVKSINNVGDSEFSNIETIAPNGEIKAKEISSALLETDAEIKKKVLAEFKKDELSCDSKDFINHDNHVLDTVDEYTIDDVIKEEYLKNTKYILGKNGCHKDLSHIRTKTECKIAAEQLENVPDEITVLNEVDNENRIDPKKRPYGCYVDKNKVYFNLFGSDDNYVVVMRLNKLFLDISQRQNSWNKTPVKYSTKKLIQKINNHLFFMGINKNKEFKIVKNINNTISFRSKTSNKYLYIKSNGKIRIVYLDENNNKEVNWSKYNKYKKINLQFKLFNLPKSSQSICKLTK